MDTGIGISGSAVIGDVEGRLGIVGTGGAGAGEGKSGTEGAGKLET